MNPKGLPLEQILEATVRRVLPNHYQNIQFLRYGGTRAIFTADWGPGKERRVVKMDISPTSPRAIRHVKRGYDTAHDILQLSQIRDAELHGIIGLSDYAEKDGHSLSVEKYFEGETLEERCARKPLNLDEFAKVFSQILLTEEYLINTGKIYHRDAKPSNFLVSDRLDVRLIDFANATSVDEVVTKWMPSAGGHFVLDPVVFGQFTKDFQGYDQSSEIYALGVDMYFALTGKYIFEFDPDNKTGISVFSGESILDPKGRIDIVKYQETIDKAIAAIPKAARKRYGQIISRCLSLEKECRYNSISSLINDFNKSKNHKSFSRRIFGSTKGIIMTILAAGVLATGGYTAKQITTNQQQLEQRLEESQKYKVAAEWNGEGLEISNNLFTTSINILEKDYQGGYPQKIFVRFQPGDEISVRVDLKELARPRSEEIAGGSVDLQGRIYLEGFMEFNEFGVWTHDHDETQIAPEAAFGQYPYPAIKIPENLPPGTYNLVVEIYAPTEEMILTAEKHRNIRKYTFLTPGKTLSRKLIPVVVGQPTAELNLESLRTGFEEYVIAKNLHGGSFRTEVLPKELTLSVSVPDFNYHKEDNCGNSSACSFGGVTPSGNHPNKPAIFQFYVKDKEGKVIHYTHLPLRPRIMDGRTMWWDLELPGKELQRQIAHYRPLILPLQD
ncbi:hypothetical protein COY27_03955 [Candidatus Woesearchaeota archaeon CG_4_10_14_0_2_um_filter_33_13]|nr:MAG: hypothetical protein COY27_03955 [Candidatus Woesearchaeota archaeon CG_4_10_14_0_2_um_filter_33_13]